MTDEERRKYKRKDALNLLDFVVLDEKGGRIEEAMGRTLNASESGILLETTVPLGPGHNVMLTIGLEEDLIDLQGRVVHVKAVENFFQCGIDFIKIDESELRILRRYLAAVKEILP